MISEIWADTVVKTTFFRTKELMQPGQQGVNHAKTARSTRWRKLNVSRIQRMRSSTNFPDNLIYPVHVHSLSMYVYVNDFFVSLETLVLLLVVVELIIKLYSLILNS